MAHLIDGKASAEAVRRSVAVAVQQDGLRPGLAVVLIGNRRDSATYVHMKEKACVEVGIHSYRHDLPGDVSAAQVLHLIHLLNQDDAIHGILVQLPLPSHLDEHAILDTIAPEKDVDGLHPINIGVLSRTLGRGHQAHSLLVPCTPRGVMHLLREAKVDLVGRKAVVVGRSDIVGKPMALLLLGEHATVTICHSRTENLADEVADADVLVVAVGRPNFIKGEWIKPGAVVIDVGINSIDDATRKQGYRLVGDVEFQGACHRASLITPVPGGVGPMTVAMLLSNCLIACRNLSSPKRDDPFQDFTSGN